jgi:hypothetical protein
MASDPHPRLWRTPQWHPDHGDPAIELDHLRSFALALLSAVPDATAVLEVPEPGLMDVRVDLPCGMVAEVYSVPSLKEEGSRRLALFLRPESVDEIEVYAESAEDASNLFALISSSLTDARRSRAQVPAGADNGP